MQMKIYKNGTLFFLFSYGLFVFIEALIQTEFSFSYVRYVEYGILLHAPLKLFFDKRIKKKYILLWVALLLVGGIVGINSGYPIKVIPIFIFAFLATNIEEDQIVKVSMFVLITVLVLTILCSMIGVLPWEKTTTAGRVRYNLGFAYTSYPANFYLHIVIMWVFLRKKKPTVLNYLILLLTNVFFYYFTRTNTVLILGILIVFMLIFDHLFSRIKNLTRLYNLYNTVIQTSFVWSCFLSLFLQIKFNNNNTVFRAINYFANYRLSLGLRAFQKYGFSIIGRAVEWNMDTINAEYLYVDSSYLNIGICYGLIILGILIVGFTALLVRENKRGNRYRVIALFFLAIHSVSDPQLFSIIYNPFIFCLGGLITISAVSYRRNNELKWDIMRKRI